jgi:chlorobactene glucosyltransferase
VIGIIVVAWIVFGITVCRLCIAVMNGLSPPYLKKNTLSSTKRISVLIPARNEEKNLPRLLESLMNQSYQNIEILVYDDQSTDKTSGVVDSYRQLNPKIQYIKGTALPDGWIGKNHACHQLAQHAKGDIFVFIDADVWLTDDLLESAAAKLESEKLQLLSVFPDQMMKTPGEALTVPLLNWVLLSFLPLVIVKKMKNPVFSIAIGQFMMFDGQYYRKHQWHREAAHSIVEDLAIGRLVRKNRLNTGMYLSDRNIFCRMYTGFKESLYGFSKNIIQVLFGSLFTLFLSLLYLVFGGIFVFWAMPVEYTIAYIGMAIVIKLITSMQSHQPVFQNIILHPFQLFSLLIISGMAILNRIKKQNTWKGRKVEFTKT